jgi:aspartyl-tRNA(Asn)/glutamyl-tRNA(Gln) amidotransferase subunit B
MPEMPGPRRARFLSAYGLREYDAGVLTSTREIADYFEEAARVSGNPNVTANWIAGDLAALLNTANTEIQDSPVSARQLGELVLLIEKGELTGKLAKEVLAKMFASGESAIAIVEREGLKKVSDTGALQKLADEVIAANPKQVEQYRAGKTTLLGFFVGQVMKATRGQADPAVLNELLKSRLG